jgi:hypothetical protein
MFIYIYMYSNMFMYIYSNKYIRIDDVLSGINNTDK